MEALESLLLLMLLSGLRSRNSGVSAFVNPTLGTIGYRHVLTLDHALDLTPLPSTSNRSTPPPPHVSS